MRWSWGRSARAVGLLLVVVAGRAGAGPLPVFDFTNAQRVREWRPTHDIGSLQATRDGMRIDISGSDPYTVGPARDYPTGTPLWVVIRLKSEKGGTAQLFYWPAGAGPNEGRSVRFQVEAGMWVEARAPAPSFGPGYSLRLDPPGEEGSCTVASIRFETRVVPKEPAWPRLGPSASGSRLLVRAGDLEVAQSRDHIGDFAVRVAGQPMARGHSRPLVGYELGGKVRWVDVSRAARVQAVAAGGGVDVTARWRDPDGAMWAVTQRFRQQAPGAVGIDTRVSVSAERRVLYLPMLMVLPGVGSFGQSKGQGLFAGLEYLDSPDTSSSEADIEGPGSHRQVPDNVRITFPLMAVQARDRYVGLLWDQGRSFSAVFDSPDRLFRCGGHVMGVIFPGSDGFNREEGRLLPYRPEVVAPGTPIVLRATLVGGRGQSVVPAVQQYVALRGLPRVPDPGMDAAGYVRLAAGGWLDSRIGDGEGRYRHAWWPGASFGPVAAADAPVWMQWLAARTNDAALADRLRTQAAQAISLVLPGDYNGAGVSHVRYPVPALVYGSVGENVRRAREGARHLLGNFEPDGTVLYRPGTLDLGRTHFARHANGLSAQMLGVILQASALSGDADLQREGLRVLRAHERYLNTVPRGAQTWEVPLHTPDILASGHLVSDYVLGYELTGDRALLDRAVYWAWTGVPFVYLVNPAGRPAGPYATIAVFGATQWKAPNWMGMPVQWCGLVYSDALYRLARYDSSGPWRKLADGIAASGIQQSWPRGDADLQGLLPDSFNLRPQTRNPVAINPGTVQANAVRLFGGPEVYDYRVFREAGVYVHAPGAIADAVEGSDRVAFSVRGWLGRPYYVLVAGLRAQPTVSVNGRPVDLAADGEWDAAAGHVVLRVEGSPAIEVRLR